MFLLCGGLWCIHCCFALLAELFAYCVLLTVGTADLLLCFVYAAVGLLVVV